MLIAINMSNKLVDLSIVIPVKNEEGNILHLGKEIAETLDPHPWIWECYWIDDGSDDQSLDALCELNRIDARHQYISFEKNSGQSAALWAGFQQCRGKIIVTLDGDGQNDPSDIYRLIDKLETEQVDMVNGYRETRKDNFLRKLSSKVANIFRNWITGNTCRDVGCSLRAFRSECVRHLPMFRGMHRFLPTLIAMQGYRLTEICVSHRPRLTGKSKYSINNRLWIGIIDMLGVLWIKSRLIRYKINNQSRQEEPIKTEEHRSFVTTDHGQ